MGEYDYKAKDNKIQRTKDRRAMLWRMEEEAGEQGIIQKKSTLEIGASDDVYEQQADAVAQKVFGGENASHLVKNQTYADTSIVQRKEEGGIAAQAGKIASKAVQVVPVVKLNPNSTLGGNGFGANKFQSKVNGVIKSFNIPNGFMQADVLVSGVKAKELVEIQVVYFTPTTGKPGGKEITVNGKKYQGFVDGGKNSPDVVIAGGEVGDKTRPYFYGPTMKAQKATFESWSGSSGNTVMTDAPEAAIDYSEIYFETYVVASEYNGTKKDKVLAMFTWGFTSYGTKSVHTSAINLVLTGKLSETAKTIIKNDGYDYSTTE